MQSKIFKVYGTVLFMVGNDDVKQNSLLYLTIMILNFSYKIYF